MEPFCRGIRSSGHLCDCEEFSEPAHQPPDQPLRCAECLHGKSKHPKSDSSRTQVEQPYAQGSAMSSASISGPSVPKDKKMVLSLFKHRVQSTSSASSANVAGTSRPTAVSAESARKEMLEGYRPEKFTSASARVTRSSSATTAAGKKKVRVTICYRIQPKAH